MNVIQSELKNRLLSRLDEADFTRLRPHLERIELPRHFLISSPDIPPEYTYFPEAGLGSIVIKGLSSSAEVGIFGREGMAPTSVSLGASSDPFHIFMQISGAGLRIANAHLLAACVDSLPLRNMVTRYAHTMSVQGKFTAFSNVSFTIEQRLARWLLMCHDRIDGDDIRLTHELLSLMLSNRRQSITTALHTLEGPALDTLVPRYYFSARPKGPGRLRRRCLWRSGAGIRKRSSEN